MSPGKARPSLREELSPFTGPGGAPRKLGPSGASSPTKTTPAAGGRPLWARFTAFAIAAYVSAWALRSFRIPAVADQLPKILPWLDRAMWVFGTLAVVALAVRLRARVRHGGDRAPSKLGEAEQRAVVDELKVPAAERDQVRVRVKVWPHWRRPFWLLRKAVIWLPRGLVTQDPGKRLAVRLGPLLGPIHRTSWNARTGRLVMAPGEAPVEDEEMDIPEAKTDPEGRALQVMQPILKTEQLRIEGQVYDEEDRLTGFVVRHPTNVRVAGTEAETAIGDRISTMMPPAPGDRGWKVTVDPQLDKIHVMSRPAMPKVLPNPLINWQAEFGEGSLFVPWGKGEDGKWTGWDMGPNTQCPHCLLAGATGSGKTSTIRSVVVNATRQSGEGPREVEVWLLDPKMIELMGLENWPGITRLACTIAEMAALIESAYLEMMDRYRRLRAREITRADLGVLLIVLDEYLILRAQLLRWWREEKKQKGAPPQVSYLQQMLALARSCRIHILIGIQRPDASHFEEGARDNLRARCTHDQLSQQGAQMMWGDAVTGTKPTGIRGRGIATGFDGYPVESQQFWTPDCDDHPIARAAMTQADRDLIDSLRPAAYTPSTITKSGLYVPNTTLRDVPDDSVQSEMMDPDLDVVRVRDLEVDDRIKMERGDGGRLEWATVEKVSSEPDDDPFIFSVEWDVGGGEEIEMDGAEEVLYQASKAFAKT